MRVSWITFMAMVTVLLAPAARAQLELPEWVPGDWYLIEQQIQTTFNSSDMSVELTSSPRD